MKIFGESLIEHAMKIINKKKTTKLLTKEQIESYENSKSYYICKENNIVKLELIVIIQGNKEVLCITYVI